MVIIRIRVSADCGCASIITDMIRVCICVCADICLSTFTVTNMVGVIVYMIVCVNRSVCRAANCANRFFGASSSTARVTFLCRCGYRSANAATDRGCAIAIVGIWSMLSGRCGYIAANCAFHLGSAITVIGIWRVSESFSLGRSADLTSLGCEAGCIVPIVGDCSFLAAFVTGNVASVVVCVVAFLIATSGEGYDHYDRE